MILPYLNYGNLIWSSTYVSTLQKLITSQKRAVRIVNKSFYNAHTKPIFKYLKVLPLYDINVFQTLVFMYRHSCDLLPDVFNDCFQYSCNVYGLRGRTTAHYVQPFARTNIRTFSLIIQGPKHWNALPNYLREAPTLSMFKKSVKNYLLERQGV